MIYFIGNERGQIKIGYSVRPFDRLKNLQTSSPDKLKILALMPGDKDKERALHLKYAEYHIQGEWFGANKELTLEINVLKSCYKIVPENTDSYIVFQDRFAAWIRETDEVEARYEPLISKLEAEIEELENQRDIEIDKIDSRYL